MSHHFISYSSVDAQDFAIQLYDELKAGPPSIPVWLDKRDLKTGKDWDEQIAEAIRTCESLIFVMTRDSVEDESECKHEWTLALRYKKPIVPIFRHSDIKIPYRLENRQYIDFTGDFGTGLAKLHNHLRWLASPEGISRTLNDRLKEAQRDLRRAPIEQQARIRDDIAQLEKQIADQTRIIEDPKGEAKRVEKRIAIGLERERQPEKPVGGVARTKFINPPPGMAPTYFQDRHVETKLIGDFLKNDTQLLMTVVGRAGMGKTAMVCRLLKSLENGQLPDEGGALGIDGIVYLSETGSRKVTVPNLYADLCQLLPDDVARRLDEVYKNPKASTESKIQALLSAFPQGRVILLLDNFENILDPETRSITNAELDEALRTVLNLPQHALKVILTTRVAPYDLALVHPEKQIRLDLDKGLKSPYAENILREMDLEDKLGLKTAPLALLNEARERTQGNPRALEALFAILSADRDTTLPEILNDTKKSLPEYVVKILVGEAFSRLDANAQQVMQALAIYTRPVTPAAVDYLLQPYLSAVDSAPVLNRLVNMQFVRRETGARYYMHPVDHEYALSRVPEGTAVDRKKKKHPQFTRFALLHRGAEYFKLIRTPRENWKTIDDLAPQLAEFDLRCAGQDYDTAASVLLEIDFDYLFLWGYSRLMIELHERLVNKLSDTWLNSVSAGDLGTAYWSVGEYRKAIDYYEKALVIAREIGNREGDAWLGGLGNAYSDLGQIQKAIEYYEKALVIVRETGDRLGEGAWLGGLGTAYRDLGQVQKAIDYYKKALVITRESGDRYNEGVHLGNLGNAYKDLGQIQKAIEYHEKALVIAREIGDRRGEGRHLGNLGGAYSDLGQIQKAIEYHEKSLTIAQEIGNRYSESLKYTCLGDLFSDQDERDKAVQYYNQAIVIADEIKNIQCQHESRCGLSCAHLFAGNLPDAHATIELACKYDYPLNNHNALVLLGLITLCRGDRIAARKAFADAIETSHALLKHSGRNYSAFNAKGLALCGMAVCEEDTRYIKDAISAYKAAREITKAAGIVERDLGLFNELAKADSRGLLVDVQAFLATFRR
jgi:tetratricopeptide (TPR) repeat protein